MTFTSDFYVYVAYHPVVGIFLYPHESKILGDHFIYSPHDLSKRGDMSPWCSCLDPPLSRIRACMQCIMVLTDLGAGRVMYT